MDNSKCHIVYVSPIVAQDRRLARYDALDGVLGAGPEDHGLEIINHVKVLVSNEFDSSVCMRYRHVVYIYNISAP
jgi:hypothetical protein